MKNQILTLVALLLITFSGFSQRRVMYDEGSSKIQHGVSAKLILDIPYKKKLMEWGNLRLGVASGIGFTAYEGNITSLNVEYSAAIGGLGTYNNKTTSYFVIAPHFCQQLDRNHHKNPGDALINNQPLYYFSDLVNPPLQNPFKSSISVGANWIHYLNERQTAKWQRVAHLGLKHDVAQLVYNNDGGVLLKYWGDKEDRYFTGCGFLKIHLREHLAVNQFGISFYKFTGYNYMSFEISDELLYSSVDYKDSNQNFFNRGFWSFQVGNSIYGDIFIRYNNPRNVKEVQNFIHYNMGFGYHQTLSDSFYSFGFSPSIYQTNLLTK